MKITCLGAVRTVTGASYLVEKYYDSRFLVDCGFFQSARQIERRNWLGTVYRSKDLQAIIITHAHIDHSWLVPRVVRLGYKQPIYATEVTCELLKILWLDLAHIQEMEVKWQSRKNKRQGKRGIDPLYQTSDAEAATALLRPVKLELDHQLHLPHWNETLPLKPLHPDGQPPCAPGESASDPVQHARLAHQGLTSLTNL
ncbi:hypothetical protein DFAR_1530010 [Desulfarculales bacterium]